ncbi:hypothetical protein AB0D68_11045 [Streptomyces sp. NPDC048212]|uniref:hypothetical protein n=1 Tax=Streptomyces sp. NPDC048212 TaxID=3156658 RepID=UPI0034012FB4
MFHVGDRVEVIVEDDPIYGYTGKVTAVYGNGRSRRIAMVLEEDSGEGLGILWFDPEELRKVEQA